MSQSKLEKVLPLIQSAAKIFVNEDGISEAEEYETKAFCQQFTVKAIMSSGFNIGKTNSMPNTDHIIWSISYGPRNHTDLIIWIVTYGAVISSSKLGLIEHLHIYSRLLRS